MGKMFGTSKPTFFRSRPNVKDDLDIETIDNGKTTYCLLTIRLFIITTINNIVSLTHVLYPWHNFNRWVTKPKIFSY